MLRSILIVLLSTVVVYSCSKTNQVDFINDGKPKVVIFLAPQCPLCINYTKDLKELIVNYNEEIDFYGVVAGVNYSMFEMDSFLQTYDLPLKIVFDSDYSIVENFNAKITPEVFLVNKQNEILYSGLIDNWLGALGRRRNVVTEYYLRDAIDSFLNDSLIKISKTDAIGCFIE